MPQSDSTTAVGTLKQMVRKFIDARDWDQFHSPKDLSIGLIIEAGELLEHFRFRENAEISERLSTPEFREEVANEMADVLFFLLAMSRKLDIDLSDALAAKMILSEKHYPVEKARGKNLKYTAYTSKE